VPPPRRPRRPWLARALPPLALALPALALACQSSRRSSPSRRSPVETTPQVAGPTEGPSPATFECEGPPSPSPSARLDPMAGPAPCPDLPEPPGADGVGTTETLLPPRRGALPESGTEVFRFGCAHACAPRGARAHLLAWYVIEDDRPLRNDNALVAVIAPPNTQGPRTTLVQMYRHAFNRAWNVNLSFHSDARPVARFEARPTNAEIYAWLTSNRWDFAPHGDWRLLAGNVLDGPWAEVTGQPPERFFPKGLEQDGG
jgi:hypothetical protein